jgi:carboxypeptidase C (cathepsin A)
MKTHSQSENYSSEVDLNDIYVESESTVSRVHHIHLVNKPLSFISHVTKYNVKSKSCKTFATLFQTAYVKKISDNKRPILFLFNGGPGSSSSLLHFKGIGPYQLKNPHYSLENEMILNENCPLSHYDLVFIDPIDTGFSRLQNPLAAEPLLSVSGDAKVTAMTINLWLIEHNRVSSAKFIIGESYGTVRAVKIVTAYSEQLQLNGIILIGMISDLEPNVMSSVGYLPTMAFGSCYHGLTLIDQSTPEQFYQQMKAFSLGKYHYLLSQWNNLGETERWEGVEHLSKMIGLNKDYLYSQCGRVNRHDYMLLLLNGYRIGSLDVRVKTKKIAYFDEKNPN